MAASETVESEYDAANESDAGSSWIISQDETGSLLSSPVERVQLQFEELFGCKNHQTCPKEAALLDYYVSGFWWAKETNFTSEQISFIVTLLHTLLGNVMEKQMSAADNAAFAKTAIAARQSLLSETEPGPLFDVKQAAAIEDYFKCSLFQHYTMYEFLFHHGRERQLHRHEQAAERDGGVAEEYSLEEVKEALEEALGEMLPGVQAEFTAKLRIREEACLARIERLQSASSK
ncbi:ciliary-associated calcium-binding coiled-coil protein 1 isoform X2 [Denticeps clupeoides]|uniref:ciliary-associated calcium-binding coiled-coil protein 1 isoform X2 n=1 Tax=Denticeps clupeoides TaxID=299321 RepID=UPI0010A36FFE|nr:ciliary-associated calcium-binding coiled-coil protein 1 isoform X2 [Denticeps clupeoides]